jgi:hypothetical protein
LVSSRGRVGGSARAKASAKGYRTDGTHGSGPGSISRAPRG